MANFNINSTDEKVKHPFTVPDNYFDNFTESLLVQLPEKKYLDTQKEVTLFHRAMPWLYMAAMVASVALFFRFVAPSDGGAYADVINLDHTSIKKALADISEDEFFEIIEDRARSVSYHQTMLSDSSY